MMTIKTRTIKRCRIYQIELRDARDVHSGLKRIAFRDYESALKECHAYGHDTIPSDIYKVVFDGQLGTNDLEEIFRIFNLHHPAGYMGRSLSMSDIVELYIGTESTFFYCDRFGFEKISFNPADAKPLEA